MQSAVVNAAFRIDKVMCKGVSLLTSFLALLAAFYEGGYICCNQGCDRSTTGNARTSQVKAEHKKVTWEALRAACLSLLSCI